MTDEIRAAVANYLNRFDEIGVTWDRCTYGDDSAWAFGWIERADGRFDFVVTQFQWGKTKDLDAEPVQWLAASGSTSSAKHSVRVSELLVGTAEGHRDCERVEKVFGALVTRKVQLRAGGTA